jgi:hypothetical protein
MRSGTSIAGLLLVCVSIAQAADINQTLDNYRSEGATAFSADHGKAMWTEQHSIEGQKRSCSSCHTANPASPGKHAKTGKGIDPMAASVNPERYTDTAKIAKWFKRNCKWTLGRECTPQEKGDFLTYLNNQ